MADRIAIVGAGLAGLTCARALVRAGRRVVVYDKSRAAGGRMATRREGAFAFDHGAQYFTIRDAQFASEIEELEHGGLVASWEPRWPSDTSERTAMRVGVPGMSAIGRHYAGGIDIRFGTHVAGVARTAQGWHVIDAVDSIVERYAAVLLAVPAPQAVGIARNFPEFAAKLDSVTMSPCWAVMAAWEQPLAIDIDADWRADPILPWIARNRSKPGRSGPDTWVLHASAEWSATHLEDDAAAVALALLAALPQRLRGIAPYADTLPPPAIALAHRWRHARVEKALGIDALWDAGLGLGACGDWCVDARIEAAYLSGRALAAHVEGGTR